MKEQSMLSTQESIDPRRASDIENFLYFKLNFKYTYFSLDSYTNLRFFLRIYLSRNIFRKTVEKKYNNQRKFYSRNSAD